ncbi:YbfB/YjiJ family MFS transporter [Agrobacterium tumefaciens]|uniref:YbfB/YjiJ family MFS transporter n=1 Tax=Agrobacterium tumefaciens TaxID=358 RepID=UPI00287E7617|nr:YbfB/YjiJ family MFS transporter [Agrobacterium tumefaciens]MDS7595465.1 YbfB/YjiJ family MFS transporter [Agrobacterium tumefaciens]
MNDLPNPRSFANFEAHRHSGLLIALAGSLSLAVAMGIGRFAFTPLMPAMAKEGLLDIPFGSTLASANYLGYLAGAMLMMGAPKVVSDAVMIRISLVATAILTAGMALDIPVAWLGFRFLAGVFSAFAFVATSAWAFAHLTRRSASHLGGIVFTGPGVGIAISGVVAFELFGSNLPSSWVWLVFAAISLVVTIALWQVFTRPEAPHERHANNDNSHKLRVSRWEMILFAFSYGLAGFGYIITATFLPAMAHAELQPSIWLDGFWPLFGIAAAVGCIAAIKLIGRFDPRLLLFFAYLIQALGVLTIVPFQTLLGFTASSFLVGLPFTAINFFAMKEVQRLRPHAASRYMGMLTALYSIGQIAGPPVVAALLSQFSVQQEGFNAALILAAISLVLGGVAYLFMYIAWPLAAHRSAR